MIKSAQPRKKRKFLYNAPLHARAKMLNAHLSKELRKQLKKRTTRVRKGDTVKILRGKFKGLAGKVLNVNLTSAGINVEGAVLKKIGGKELPVLIDASNIVITQRAEEKK